MENCRLRPAGGWMPQAAWEAMLADALHPLGMTGMELNPPKCTRATTEGVPGLHLRLCPPLENPWH